MADTPIKDYEKLDTQSKATIAANARSQGITPQEYLTTRGGVYKSGYYGDTPEFRRLSEADYTAAQGSPDYVKNLLQQGYDLEQIYAPYKNVMAQLLELNPDEIELNDNTLRSAIGQDREMNIYDFKKALRKDSRWQYTENARTEVADSVLGVLRDFGFQG